jgi:hypothetical protein
MRRYAGIGDVFRPGLTVERHADRLRRFGYIEYRLVRGLALHVNRVAWREIDYALCRRSWEVAEHADSLRRRIQELRYRSPSILFANSILTTSRARLRSLRSRERCGSTDNC